MISERYTPTPEEKERTLAKGDLLKVSGDGIFATLQGEGVTAGEPSVFLRLHNCNLQCGFEDKGWRCDAWYTWDKTTQEYWKESSNDSIQDTTKIKKAWQEKFQESDAAPRLVITGGEPLLQQDAILNLLEELSEWHVEIETNGTLIPRDELKDCQINCSPKLATSGNSLRARYRPAALQKIASFPNSWFKFVVVTDTDIEEVRHIADENNLDYGRILLMSEGTDPDKLTASDARLETIARSMGSAVTARNQIFWFGNTRAT